MPWGKMIIILFVPISNYVCPYVKSYQKHQTPELIDHTTWYSKGRSTLRLRCGKHTDSGHCHKLCPGKLPQWRTSALCPWAPAQAQFLLPMTHSPLPNGTQNYLSLGLASYNSVIWTALPGQAVTKTSSLVSYRDILPAIVSALLMPSVQPSELCSLFNPFIAILQHTHTHKELHMPVAMSAKWNQECSVN
jgi:hypothetical protein